MEDPAPPSEASNRPPRKRGRPPKHLPKEHDGDAMNRDRTTEQTYRESSPDDFDEARNKFKRNRASEGTSSIAHKPSDQTLIGYLCTATETLTQVLECHALNHWVHGSFHTHHFFCRICT
ncbi:hypothetical protein V8G54_021161 [Vigna mungo]|uniref:Uncharacterized protein n=1 Tax=Vigna mungo TaxID=3915 RepID=A0AAQ3NCW1_VIGMU